MNVEVSDETMAAIDDELGYAVTNLACIPQANEEFFKRCQGLIEDEGQYAPTLIRLGLIERTETGFAISVLGNKMWMLFLADVERANGKA